MLEFENIEHHKSEAERLGKEMAQKYEEGWMEYLVKTDTNTIRRFQQRYEAINYQLEFGIISEEDYYRMLEEARDEYFNRSSQEWYKYTEEIYKYRISKIEEYENEVQKAEEKRLKEEAEAARESERLLKEQQREAERQYKAYINNIKSIYNEIAAEINSSVNDVINWGTKAFSEVEGKRQNYSEKLKDYAGSPTGFDTKVTWVDNYWPTGDSLKMVDYSLVDYEKEIEKLKSFNNSITKLREKAGNIDKDVFSMFFDELRDMSIEDAKILTDLLLEASDEDFAKHFELYEEKQNLADNMASDYYDNDFVEIMQTVSEELGKVFEEIPEEFFEYGKELGEVVFEGMLTKINEFLHGIVVEAPEIDASQNTTNVQNTEFSPVYYFYGDRESTSRTRINAKNDALFSYFRGME